MFLLKCKKCGNTMKYQPRTYIITKKGKKCVYCGFSMKVTHSIQKKV